MILQILRQTTLRAVCRHLPKASSVSCAGYSTLTGQVQVTSAATTSQLLRGTANHCSLLQHKLCQPWQSHAALSSFGAVNQNKVPQTHPQKGKVVYVGHLAKHVRFVKAFSLSTSILGLALQPYLLSETSDMPLMATVALGSIVSFFIFLTPLLLHWITKRYVTLLYYNQDSGMYTATTFNILVQKRDKTFRASEVTVPDVPGIFTSFLVGGKPLFVDPTMFVDRDAFIHLMHYDEPLDWELPPDKEYVEELTKQQELKFKSKL